MLRTHLNAIEQVLLAKSQIAGNAGHPVLRGNPREWFVQEFLETHLPSSLEIGQGEIISSRSEPVVMDANSRHQLDVVAYRRSFPRVSYSPSDTAFLAEGVIYSVEVKSKLTKGTFPPNRIKSRWKAKDGLASACEASMAYKSLVPEYATRLTRSISFGIDGVGQAVTLSRFLSYVLAYDSAARIPTVANWFAEIMDKLECNPDDIIDMICVLGKGCIWRVDSFIYPENDSEPKEKWAYLVQETNNLYTMFMHMLCMNHDSSAPSKVEYLKKFIEWTKLDEVHLSVI